MMLALYWYSRWLDTLDVWQKRRGQTKAALEPETQWSEKYDMETDGRIDEGGACTEPSPLVVAFFTFVVVGCVLFFLLFIVIYSWTLDLIFKWFPRQALDPSRSLVRTDSLPDLDPDRTRSPSASPRPLAQLISGHQSIGVVAFSLFAIFQLGARFDNDCRGREREKERESNRYVT